LGWVAGLEAAPNVEQRAVVLEVVRVDIGSTSVMLHVIPVVQVSVVVKLLLSLDLLDAAAVAHGLPALRVVLHERLAQARIEISTGELDVVGRLELAVLEAASVVLAKVGVIRVACECECGVGHLVC